MNTLGDANEIGNGNTDQTGGFDDINQVLAYLLQRGFKISQSGIYKHQKEGKISKDKKDHRYLLAAVEKYAKSYLPLVATGKLIADVAEVMQNRKLNAEIRRLEAQAEKEEFNLNVDKSKYIAREEMIRELVGRGLILDSSLRHMLKTAVPEIIDLVGGDQGKAGQVMDELMTFVDDVMNSFASVDDFVVTLAADQEGI